MTQLPRDILTQYKYLGLKKSDLYVLLMENNTWHASGDILQTAHCLEVILSGSLQIQHGSSITRLSDGDIHFRKRGNYQITLSENYRSLVFFMENEFINSFLHTNIINFEKQPYFGDRYVLQFKSSSFIAANVTESIRNVVRPSLNSNCIIKYIAYQILLQLISHEGNVPFLSFLAHLVSDQMTYIDFFIESNFTNPLTLKAMAEKTGRSLSRFKKEFYEIYHETPIRWLFNRRLEYAEHLIRNTSDTISMIAFASGFTNLSHFSKAYKSKYGTSPRLSKSNRRVNDQQ